jgi:hypothetical protein
VNLLALEAVLGTQYQMLFANSGEETAGSSDLARRVTNLVSIGVELEETTVR